MVKKKKMVCEHAASMVDLPKRCFRGSRGREYDVGRRKTKPAVQHVSGHCYGLRSNTVDQHESLFPVKIRNNYASFR